ncbi:hypothetical protein HD806DRAFT_480729 [Xylariaceae sp. AK1471]|nr:hypothetical protein HD806DRAFT_480729 [Xylariaceae sp. AK1471]
MPDSKSIIGSNYEGEDLRLWIAYNKLYDRERGRGQIKGLTQDLNTYNVNTQAFGSPHTQVG